MEDTNFFTIKAIIELLFKNSHLCEICYNSYLPELNIKKSNRSKVIMEKKETSLIFNIESNDITAFRAAVNDIIAFGKIIDNTLRIAHTP